MRHLLKLALAAVVVFSSLCGQVSNFIFVDHYGEFADIQHGGRYGIFIYEENIYPIVNDLQEYYYLRAKFPYVEKALGISLDINKVDVQIQDAVKKRGRQKLWTGVGIGAGAVLVVGLVINILVLTR